MTTSDFSDVEKLAYSIRPIFVGRVATIVDTSLSSAISDGRIALFDDDRIRTEIAGLSQHRDRTTQSEMFVGETLLGDGRGSTTTGRRVKRMWSTELRIQPFEKRAHFAGPCIFFQAQRCVSGAL